MSKLTEQQKILFNSLTSSLRKQVALEYIKLNYDNGTKAYLNACKKLKKKPSKNPVTSASEILNYPNVTAFIDSVRVKVAEEVQVDAQWVLEQSIDMFKTSKRAGDLKASKGFLELVGKNASVMAFKEKIELDANVQVTEITRKII